MSIEIGRRMGRILPIITPSLMRMDKWNIIHMDCVDCSLVTRHLPLRDFQLRELFNMLCGYLNKPCQPSPVGRTVRFHSINGQVA